MIGERKKLKNETTLEHKRKYRELINLVIQKSIEAKKKCKDIEIQMRTGNRDAMYKSVKKFFNNYKPKRGAIEDNNGVIIYENKHGGHIWKEYLEQL